MYSVRRVAQRPVDYCPSPEFMAADLKRSRRWCRSSAPDERRGGWTGSDGGPTGAGGRFRRRAGGSCISVGMVPSSIGGRPRPLRKRPFTYPFIVSLSSCHEPVDNQSKTARNEKPSRCRVLRRTDHSRDASREPSNRLERHHRRDPRRRTLLYDHRTFGGSAELPRAFWALASISR